jgi:hypothetical protein
VYIGVNFCCKAEYSRRDRSSLGIVSLMYFNWRFCSLYSDMPSICTDDSSISYHVKAFLKSFVGLATDEIYVT